MNSLGGTVSEKKNSGFEKAMACQENVKSMNSGRVSTLRKDFNVNMTNFAKLSGSEQKVLNRYLHDFELSFSDGLKPVNYELTTYVFESSSRRSLGSKIVIHEPGHPEKNVGTYFVSLEGGVLFSHLGGLIPSQKWDCEKAERETQVAANSVLTSLATK